MEWEARLGATAGSSSSWTRAMVLARADGPGPSWSMPAMTLPDGSFQASVAADRTYNLLARSDLAGFALRAGVSPGEKDVVLTLRPGGRLLLQVQDPNGAPVEGAFVNIEKVSGASFAGMGSRTDGQGTADLAAPVGTVQLRVSKDRLNAEVTANVVEGTSVPVQVKLAEAPRTSTP